MSAVSIGIAIGTTALSTGLAASGAFNPAQPNQPNLAAASKELSDAQAQALPVERGIAAAAQTGGEYTFSLPPGVDPAQYGFDTLPQGTTTAQHTQVYVPGVSQPGDKPGTIPQGQWVPYNAADFQGSGKYAALGTPQLRQVTNQNGTYTVSFKGYGGAQTQATIAKQNAANQLKLAQKYDPQIIAGALAQEKEADPQSFAARQRMSELIQQQINNPAENPVANTIADQIQSRAKAGKGLDDFDQGVLAKGVSGATGDRGGSFDPNLDYSLPLTTGAAGVARQQAGIQAGVGELASGTSPEDIKYRQEQQNLANLSAEVNGATPQSQFKSLSGAQSGPTPQFSGSPLPTANTNLSSAGSSALSSYGTQLSNANAQANPWMAGLSTVLNATGALGQIVNKP